MFDALDSEFLVNTSTFNWQFQPVVAQLASGGFVMSWADMGGDGVPPGIKAQIFDAMGEKIGGEFLVGGSRYSEPTITGLASGAFVVSWASEGSDGSLSGISAQVFTATGSKIGSPFVVNTETLGSQATPTITSLASGGFIVSWQDSSGRVDMSGSGIKAQIFNSSGAKVGGEFLINSATDSNQQLPVITGLASGGFVVSWEDYSGKGGDSSISGIKAQIFGASGAKVGGEFLVNTSTEGAQRQPALTSLSSGGFVVSWLDGSGQGGDSSAGIKAQVFGATGAKVGSEFLVNTTTLNTQSEPTITSLSTGGFVVSWTDASGDGGDYSGLGIKAQIFDSSGLKTGDEFLVNTETLNDQSAPTITGLASGGFVIGWVDASGIGGDSSAAAIKAQIYHPSDPSTRTLTLSSSSISETAVNNVAVAQFGVTGSVGASYDTELLSDSTGGAFAILQNKLVVIDNTKLDYQSASTATLTFRVTDSSGFTFDQAVTVDVAFSTTEERLSAGSEFLVNSATLYDQKQPTVTGLASGGFVVSWEELSVVRYSSVQVLKAQIFSAGGTKVGNEFLIQTSTQGLVSEPTITGLVSGGFVVTWVGSDTSSDGIKAQIFSSSGTKVGEEFLVNTTTQSNQTEPTITSLTSGGFVVSWTDDSGEAGDLSSTGIVAQIFSGSGARVGGEFLINTETLNGQHTPTISSLASGGFVVSWSEYSGGRAQIFDANGVRVASEIQFDTATTSPQFSVTGLASGGFVVSWTEKSDYGSNFNVKAQVFEATGSRVGFEFMVNTGVLHDQQAPTITSLASGGFVVSWEDSSGQGYDSNQSGIKAQIFNANGAKVGPEFLVNSVVAGAQSEPTIASLSSGGFVVSWSDKSGEGGDNSGLSIKARVFSPVGDQAFANNLPSGSVTIAGTASRDQVLIASNSLTDADGLGTITYQWLRSGVAVQGATGESYALGQADVGQHISVAASYTDQQGTAERVASVATQAVANGFSGTSGNDTMTGTSGDDSIYAQAGNDTINALGGNDFIDGGLDIDTALYSGLFRSYEVQRNGASGTVAGGAEGGTDTLKSIEILQFQDGKFLFDADGVAAQVTRLYDTVLQRAPDQMGLDLWVDQLEDFGGTLKDVANGFLNSTEFQAKTGNLTNAEYVDFLFLNALGRASDADGKAFWVGKLSSGSDRADLLIGFSESSEHRALTANLVDQGFFNTNDAYQSVALLYDSFAGRLPDASGLIYWGEAISSGSISLHQAAEGFASSAEFRGHIAGMNHAELVDYMYLNTLDRPADQAGRDFWVARLDAGLSDADLLLGFSQSTEHSYLLAEQITRGIITNDAYQSVALAYDSFVGSQPDASDIDYSGQAPSSGSIDYMYLNTLDRHADQADGPYWLASLDAGLSAADLLLGFSQSTEHSYLVAEQITAGIDYF